MCRWADDGTMPRPGTPFAPRSNTYLLPGDFWAIPLSDGRFAAGRVLTRQAFGPTDRVGVIVGLLDWAADEPPSQDAIAGARVAAWSLTGFEAISMTSGQILGNRPLELDGIEPPVLTYQVGERTSVWGWRTIVLKAEERFCPAPRRTPEPMGPA